MHIAWIAVTIVPAWLTLAIVVARLVGRVVRRGEEDALLYGSLAATVHSWIARPSDADPSDAPPARES